MRWVDCIFELIGYHARSNDNSSTWNSENGLFNVTPSWNPRGRKITTSIMDNFPSKSSNIDEWCSSWYKSIMPFSKNGLILAQRDTKIGKKINRRGYYGFAKHLVTERYNQPYPITQKISIQFRCQWLSDARMGVFEQRLERVKEKSKKRCQSRLFINL